jgi:hypothetical protein
VWIFGTTFFVSIVKKGGEGEWQVRARARRHLQNLMELANLDRAIIASTHSDYAYRIIVNAQELHQLFAAMEGSIRYSNVKAAVARVPGEEKYEAAMHRVWSIMADALQPTRPYSGSRLIDQPERPLDDFASNEPEPLVDEVARAKRGNGRKRNKPRPVS